MRWMFWIRLAVFVAFAVASRNVSDTWASGWLFGVVAVVVCDGLKEIA